jgi:hypothetical protein
MNHTAYMILDIETEADLELAKLIDDNDPYAKPLCPEPVPAYVIFRKEYVTKETIAINESGLAESTIKKKLKKLDGLENEDYEKLYEEVKIAYKKALKNLAVNPIFAMIKIASLKFDDEEEIFTLTNRESSYTTEQNIIERIYELLYQHVTGAGAIKNILQTKLLVTNNGKHFDIKLLIERGAVVGARIDYRWLERLTNRHCDEHYDFMDVRAYISTPVNKLSLTKNLLIRYGPEFMKEKIDFQECTFDELLEYHIDEMYKFEFLIRNHFGIETRTPAEFLSGIAKPPAEVSDDDLPV